MYHLHAMAWIVRTFPLFVHVQMNVHAFPCLMVTFSTDSIDCECFDSKKWRKKTKINWMNENYMLHSLWEKLIIPTFKCSINDQFIPLAYAQFGHYELFINQLTKYVFVYFCFHRTNYIFHIVHILRFGFCPKVLTWIAVAWYIRVYTVEVCPHFSFYCC